MGFKDFIIEQNAEEQALLEGAGNLKGLPSAFIKELASKYTKGDTGSGLAGENSEVKLYKSNAKQKDLTAAVRSISGMDYVKKELQATRYSGGYSSAEKAADLAKKSNAGIVVKINGEWAYLAYAWMGKYSLLTPTADEITKKARRSSAYNTSWYDSRELTATDLSNYIDFKEDNVEIYIITSDKNRIQKQIEREEQKKIDQGYVPEYKKKAIIRFLNSKSDNLVNNAQEDLNRLLEDTMNKIKSNYAAALKGNYDGSSNIKSTLAKLESSMKNFDSIAYAINDMIKDGKIKETSSFDKGNDTYGWKKFKEIIKDMEKETGE